MWLLNASELPAAQSPRLALHLPSRSDITSSFFAFADGSLDVLYLNPRVPPQIWLNDGNGVFTPISTPLGIAGEQGGTLNECGRWAWVDCGNAGYLGDFNADGNLDVLVKSSGRVDLWLGDGEANFVHTVKNWRGGSGGGAMTACDIDGNGQLGKQRCLSIRISFPLQSVLLCSMTPLSSDGTTLFPRALRALYMLHDANSRLHPSLPTRWQMRLLSRALVVKQVPLSLSYATMAAVASSRNNLGVRSRSDPDPSYAVIWITMVTWTSLVNEKNALAKSHAQHAAPPFTLEPPVPRLSSQQLHAVHTHSRYQ